MIQNALNLLLNTSLLVSICIIFNLYYFKIMQQKVAFRLIGGVILGLAGIVLMSISVKLPNEVIFDTRSILLSISGLFYGVLPTSVAAIIIIAYRIFLGGPGVYMGMAVAATSAAVGVIWRKFRKNPEDFSKLEFYIFGLINHLLMLICMFLLPKEIITETLITISLPVIIIYPLGTFALCMIIQNAGKNLTTEKMLAASEIRFLKVFERSPIGITIETPEKILYANSEYLSILGMSLREIQTNDWRSYTHPDDIKKDESLSEKLLSGEIDKFDITKRYIRKDGEIIWVHLFMGAVYRGEIPSKSEYVCIIQNITEEVRREQSLLNSERKQRETTVFLTTLLDSIPDHIFYKNKEGVYLGCNRAFVQISGISKEDLIGKYDYEIYDEITAKSFIDADQKALKDVEQVRTEENVTYPNGDAIVTETLKTRYLDAEGEVAGLIGISRDITKRKREQERIEYLSTHDIMTGLYNRMFFDAELDRIDASQLLPYSIITIDIDSLKLTNDMFGHSAGDKLIKLTADLLKDCCEKAIVARIGGDEFCVILPGVDEIELKGNVENLNFKFEKNESAITESGILLSVSLGFATKSRSDQTIAEITNTAEELMYRRKLLKHQSIRSTLLSTMKDLLFSKSNETMEHAERMAKFARKLGKAVGLSELDMDALELMATLHDLGKIGISNDILSKPGQLNKNEWAEIKKHPEIGYRIAFKIPELHDIAGYILSHHERWDGEGYPAGLSGKDIPYISRLISVVDAFDAMTEDRPYRKAISKEEAAKELLANAGTQFDPEIVESFVKDVLEIDLAE